MKSIAVFCASSIGFDSVYYEQSKFFGEFLAQHDITVVYGGGRMGLMGAVADGALSFGGKVIGVIPKFLNSKEIGHREVSELIEVDNMHQRKKLMNDLSDAVVALPGGFGTMEELFEMLTWAQLGLHRKPVALLNINGFFDHLIQFIEQMVHAGLLKQNHLEMLIVEREPAILLDRLQNYVAPEVPKWLDAEQM